MLSRNELRVLNSTQSVPLLHQALLKVREVAAKGGREVVRPGDIVTVEVDTVILFDNNFMPSIWQEILRTDCPERVVVILDHRVPDLPDRELPEGRRRLRVGALVVLAVRDMVVSVLMSPHFLYRVELGTSEKVAENAVKLYVSYLRRKLGPATPIETVQPSVVPETF